MTEISIGKNPIKEAAMTLLGQRCWVQARDRDPHEDPISPMEGAYRKLSKLEGARNRALKRELLGWQKLVVEKDKAIMEREGQLKEEIGAKREAQQMSRLQREAQAQQCKEYA